MLQRPTPAFLASKQPAVENHAFLTAAANTLSLSPLLHIIPRVYNHSIPSDVITCICFEFLKNMCKASLHSWKTNPLYFCMCMYMLTHIYNKYMYREMWLDLWLTFANQEKRMWTMCCGTAHWQLLKIVVGYPSLCLAMLAVGWSTEYVMKRQKTSAGGSFGRGMTSPFSLSDRLRICKAWRLQAAQRQSFQEEESTNLRC